MATTCSSLPSRTSSFVVSPIRRRSRSPARSTARTAVAPFRSSSCCPITSTMPMSSRTTWSGTMASGDDLVERMRRLGFRASHDALSAFLTHAHKSRLGPTETIEQLVDLEERSRAAVNLARRTRAACLGTFKPLDRFDWSHPKEIDRDLVERLLQLDFVERGENVLLKGA